VLNIEGRRHRYLVRLKKKSTSYCKERGGDRWKSELFSAPGEGKNKPLFRGGKTGVSSKAMRRKKPRLYEKEGNFLGIWEDDVLERRGKKERGKIGKNR